MKTIKWTVTALLLLGLSTSTASAARLYVNNRTGSDRNDGAVPNVESLLSGPVKTISRAVQLASPSDIIIIENTGVPYFEEVSLVGSRVSGSVEQPFRIMGNGAVLSGLIPVPAEAWREVKADLWKLTPYRKGQFQLVLDGQTVPEHRPEEGTVWQQVPEVPVGSWSAWKGSIYFHSPPRETPNERRFAIAGRNCGLTLYNVEHVEISNLAIQHFRLDGVNLHDRARQVRLSGLNLHDNGRTGLTVSGSSEATMSFSEVAANRHQSVLITEAGTVQLEQCQLDREPILLPSANDREVTRKKAAN